MVERITSALCSLIHFIYTFATNFYSIPAHVTWMTLLMPLKFVSWGQEIYWSCEAFLFNALLSMVATWFKSCGYTIIEMGDDVSSLYDKRVLLLANHQSTADVPTIMASLYNFPGVGGRMYWIMDHIFRYTHFGLVSTIRGDFFITEGRKHRDQMLTRFRDHLLYSYIPNRKNWLVLFPEGGFLRKRRQDSQSYAMKHHYPHVEHVTLPRTGAMRVIADNLFQRVHNGTQPPHGAEIDWLIDLTIAYPGGKPLDVIDILCKTHAACHIICHYRAYATSEIPRGHEAMTKWLYERYAEKNNMLEQYYTTGKFPDESDSHRKFPIRKPKAAECSWVRLLGYHVFFIASTYIHATYIYFPLCRLIRDVLS